MNISSFDGFNVVKERQKEPRFPAFVQETKLSRFPAYVQEMKLSKFPSVIQETPFTGNDDQISFPVTDPGNISVDISDTVDIDVYPFIKSNISENVSEEINSTSFENTRLLLVEFDSPWWGILVLLIFINISTIIGNILILGSWKINPSIRIPANINIMSLASSDLAIGMFVMPFSICKNFLSRWIFPGILCKVWLYMDLVLSTISIFNLVNIALDRFEAVQRPITYSSRTSLKNSLHRVGLCWVAAVLTCLPIYLLIIYFGLG
ncbi:muscarinic acetylcholine receptor M3 [Eurytemora carolleeae]|uniref:muscarinic acetylcholine receptor M3 n=1 Tax=Eurytemora carolleeae TaxID=1294199 RepID=UPI000C760219|nr:muscarinic acetylcholine receptor M3 [Eurytemora carolleeae]|eukprot:XP_023332565.1 muscarinic acetylcholine receptor M3-like [Eurytemora affinis]